MSGSTANGFPYPGPLDDPDVPADVQALAEAIESVLGAPHAAYAYQLTTGTALANGVGGPVLFDAELYDVGGLHSTVSNTGRMTAVKAGKYHVIGGICYPGNVTGLRQALIRKNGVTSPYVGRGNSAPSVGASQPHYAQVVQDVFLDVGDYVELISFQTSTVSLTSAVGQSETYLAVARFSFS